MCVSAAQRSAAQPSVTLLISLNKTVQLGSNKTHGGGVEISELNYVKRLYRPSYVPGVWNRFQGQ